MNSLETCCIIFCYLFTTLQDMDNGGTKENQYIPLVIQLIILVSLSHCLIYMQPCGLLLRGEAHYPVFCGAVLGAVLPNWQWPIPPTQMEAKVSTPHFSQYVTSGLKRLKAHLRDICMAWVRVFIADLKTILCFTVKSPFSCRVVKKKYRLACLKSMPPEECYERKVCVYMWGWGEGKIILYDHAQ